MRFFPFVIGLFSAVYALDLGLLLGLHRRWWRRRWLRRLTWAVPVLGALGFAAWNAGYRGESMALVRLGAGTVAVLFAQLLAVGLGLLLTVPLRLGEILWDACGRWHARPPAGTVPFPRAQVPSPEQLAAQPAVQTGVASPDRRRFLRCGLAAVPLAVSAAATGGIARSGQRPRLPEVRLRFPDLPADLEGLRVLQVSDAHVGPYVDVADLRDLVARSVALAPDLVVVTGDLCDDMPRYLDCLRALEQLTPRLGTFACLGNHEYFRGIEAVRRCFDRSRIPLLVDAGLVLPVGAARLRIAGADDPRSMGDPSAVGRLRRSVERSLDGAQGGAFHLLLSHRSQAFDTAAPLGVHLTLAGHTHGFQIGLGGRSLFERWYPRHYIWGRYGSGAAQLYTSAGVGHWFPFRLGCPPEAPLFILERETT